MKVTVQSTVDEIVVDAFYQLYVLAFAPLRIRAAARHMLTAEEFAAQLSDPRIDKYVAWDDAGAPVALTLLATDLAAVTWVSPDHFAARYPEHAARRAVYYLGLTVSHPTRGRGAFPLTMSMLRRRMATERAVCAYDVCAFNDAGHLGQFLATFFARDGVSVDRLDVQTYYAVDYAAADLDAARPRPAAPTAVAR